MIQSWGLPHGTTGHLRLPQEESDEVVHLERALGAAEDQHRLGDHEPEEAAGEQECEVQAEQAEYVPVYVQEVSFYEVAYAPPICIPGITKVRLLGAIPDLKVGVLRSSPWKANFRN